MKSWLKQQLKKKARVYILPTRMGGYLNGLIFLMFLLSIGYSNNLLLIFTLFLFGLNLIWVIQTHFHLHALKLSSLKIMDGHALEPVLLNVYWEKSPEDPVRWSLKLVGLEDHDVMTTENDMKRSQGHRTFLKRGHYQWTHLKVTTEMPFGLYKTWIYFPVKLEAFIYPEKLKNVPDPKKLNSNMEGDQSNFNKGPHDIWNLGPYQGEESRRINWKHYARSGELVIKEGEELVESNVEFRFIESDNKEYLLSKLATQMVLCHRSNTPFSFESKRRRFQSGSSEKHLQDCLKELALC